MTSRSMIVEVKKKKDEVIRVVVYFYDIKWFIIFTILKFDVNGNKETVGVFLDRYK